MAQAFEGAQTLGELCHLGIPLLLERRARIAELAQRLRRLGGLDIGPGR